MVRALACVLPCVLPLALALACGGDPEPMGSSAGESTTTATDGASSTTLASTSTSTSTSSTDATSSSTVSTDATVDPSATEPGCSFLDCVDVGPNCVVIPGLGTRCLPPNCDPFAQDCPRGQKCLPWADDGGGSWNSTKCSDIDPNPGIDGDKCTVEGSWTSGVDSCDLGFICWFVDENNEGTCIPQCKGTADAPECPDGKTCDITNQGALNLCLDECDPVLVDCPDGQLCFPSTTGSFICDFDASGEMGAYLDPCEYVNACDPGLFCADASAVPGCQDASGCCTDFCDITLMDDTQCSGVDMGAQCVPWYSEGEAPVGLEHVGACVLPP